MIVADSNLIAYLLIPGDRNNVSEEVLRRDSHWAVPILWRSEFRNILTLYMRQEGMVVEQAKITMSKAERLLSDREYAVNFESDLDFVQKTTLSAISFLTCEPRIVYHRAGYFYPNSFGVRLLSLSLTV